MNLLSEEQRSILEDRSHRPFPLPGGAWIQEQIWEHLLFIHYSVSPSVILQKVPFPLELDTFNGKAFIGIIPFVLRKLKFRMFPKIPSAQRFYEVNTRTYVRLNGKPGILFFSLDASSLMASLCARAGTGLPYYYAKMDVKTREKDKVEYYCRRLFSKSAELSLTYQPVSAIFHSEKCSIEEWMTERYIAFVPLPCNFINELNIHHKKWMLQKAEADFSKATIVEASDLPAIDTKEIHLHYSKKQHVLFWPNRIRKIKK